MTAKLCLSLFAFTHLRAVAMAREQPAAGPTRRGSNRIPMLDSLCTTNLRCS
jgi:hypothetical protein